MCPVAFSAVVLYALRRQEKEVLCRKEVRSHLQSALPTTLLMSTVRDVEILSIVWIRLTTLDLESKPKPEQH